MLDITAESAPAIIEKMNLISQISVYIMVIASIMMAISFVYIILSRKAHDERVFLNEDDFEGSVAQSSLSQRELDRLNDEQIFKNTETL